MHLVGQEKDFKFHPQRQKLRLTYLMFIDDLIMFCKAGLKSLQHIMQTLQKFHDCLGLKGNIQKSQMVFGGTSHDLQTKYMEVTGLSECSLSLKYLGVPVTASRLTKMECRGLVEKIIAKVNVWATISFSFTGRAVLINSVLFGMYSSWASIFILPVEVVDTITIIYRNYLWSGSEDFKRIPHILWQQLCLPKA